MADTMPPAQQTRSRASQRQPKVDVTTPPMDSGIANEAPINPPPAKRRRRSSGSSKASRKTSIDTSHPSVASPDQAGPPSLPTPSPEHEIPDHKEADTSDKKARLRQRNREAAQKCRKRKQRGINELQNQEAAAGTLHEALQAEATQLRDEVLMLKSMVLQHGSCGCSFIEDYIRGQAASLVHGGAETLLSSREEMFDPSPPAAQASGALPPPLDETEYTYGGMLGLEDVEMSAIKMERSPISRDSRRLPSMTPFTLDVDRSIDLHA